MLFLYDNSILVILSSNQNVKTLQLLFEFLEVNVLITNLFCMNVGGDSMNKNKDLTKFIRKFNKSITTHLSKQIKFSTNFKNGGKGNTYILKNDYRKVNKMIFVLNKNSKMDLNNPNELIMKIFNLRTFRDLDVHRELHEEGIKISFMVNQVRFDYIVMLFKSYNCSDNVLCGYQTMEGLKYAWVELVNYSNHPMLGLDEATEYFHKVLHKKIRNNEDIISNVNWTKEVLNYKFKNKN